ncbi:MAG: diacylglycerol/lipid kinase family protein [Flavisolibacter sp.]
MRKLLYIINPISGTRNKSSLQILIETKTTAAGLPFEIYPSVASGDYTFLEPIIKEERFTDIIIAGGDGTINQVINGLHRLQLPFGIIPCGSGNGLAFSAGIPKDPSRALDIIFRGKSQPTDAFLVNDHFACMLCGLGFDAQVAHDFANDPKRGLLTYVKKTVAHFFVAAPYPFELEINGKLIKTDAYFISIANSNQFGNHFTIAPKASLHDGLLDIVVMTRQNKLSVLLQACLQVGGYNKLQETDVLDEKASVLYFQTDSIKISNPGGAPLHIDGDPAESQKYLEIKLLPQCFRLIV